MVDMICAVSGNNYYYYICLMLSISALEFDGFFLHPDSNEKFTFDRFHHPAYSIFIVQKLYKFNQNPELFSYLHTLNST